MPHVLRAESAIAAVGAAVVRWHEPVAARLLIVGVGDAVRPCIVGQHADAMRQCFIGRYVQPFIAGCTAVQRLRDIGKILAFYWILAVEDTPELLVRSR